jgi:alpha-L-fucosidase
MDDYIRDIAVPQVKEILTKYGEGIPAVLWWDTPTNMNPERADAARSPLLKDKPGIIHNNRLGGGFKGDTETPEQHIPATGFKDRDWETCMTLNGTWGFKSYDHNWKPTETLVRNLIDIASKGGNYLLNVGPTGEGEIPAPSVERLEEVGKWMDLYGAAIYGTSATPFSKLAWGRCTQKPGTLFLHVFDWPVDGKLLVPGLRSKVSAVKLFGGAALQAAATEEGVVISGLPATMPNALATVIELTYEGALDVAKQLPGPDSKGVIELSAMQADIHNHLGGEAKLENDHIGYWTSEKVTVSWTFRTAQAGNYTVKAGLSCTKASEVTVSSGSAKLAATVASTTDYNKYKDVTLGTITLAAGEQSIKLSPVAGKWSPLNLRTLTLTPAP